MCFLAEVHKPFHCHSIHVACFTALCVWVLPYTLWSIRFSYQFLQQGQSIVLSLVTVSPCWLLFVWTNSGGITSRWTGPPSPATISSRPLFYFPVPALHNFKQICVLRNAFLSTSPFLKNGSIVQILHIFYPKFPENFLLFVDFPQIFITISSHLNIFTIN